MNTIKQLTTLAAIALATASTARAATFDVFDIKISAKTTTIKAMKLKDISGKPRTIHFCAPVTKAYTVVLAREKGRDADTFGSYTAGGEVYGFIREVFQAIDASEKKTLQYETPHGCRNFSFEKGNESEVFRHIPPLPRLHMDNAIPCGIRQGRPLGEPPLVVSTPSPCTILDGFIDQFR